MPTIIPKATFLKTTLLSSHVATDGTLVLQSGDGARLGSLGANEVYAVTAVLNPGTSETIVGNFNATAISGDTLTGVTGDALGADVGVAAGTPIQVRLTPAWLAAVEAAIRNLEAVTEVSVTGAITLTSSALGKVHRCSGTSADYPVVLPTAVGFAGQTIGFRMAAGLTKLVTIDGNGSQTIDGALTRIMWAGETAVLESDGANWVKLSGRTIPMVCQIRLGTTNQTVPVTTFTQVTLDQTDQDPTGLMADLVNHRVVIARPGRYWCQGVTSWFGLAHNTARARMELHVNGAQAIGGEQAGLALSYPDVTGSAYLTLAVGDLLTLLAYYDDLTGTGTNHVNAGATADACLLVAQESPQW